MEKNPVTYRSASFEDPISPPPDPLRPEPEPQPTDISPETDVKKVARRRIRYSRANHDRDMREVNFLMHWVTKNIAKVALRAESYNGRRRLNTYDKQRYVERLWGRFAKNTVNDPFTDV